MTVAGFLTMQPADVTAGPPLTYREFMDMGWMVNHRLCVLAAVDGVVTECVSCGELRPL